MSNKRFLLLLLVFMSFLIVLMMIATGGCLEREFNFLGRPLEIVVLMGISFLLFIDFLIGHRRVLLRLIPDIEPRTQVMIWSLIFLLAFSLKITSYVQMITHRVASTDLCDKLVFDEGEVAFDINCTGKNLSMADLFLIDNYIRLPVMPEEASDIELSYSHYDLMLDDYRLTLRFSIPEGVVVDTFERETSRGFNESVAVVEIKDGYKIVELFEFQI